MTGEERRNELLNTISESVAPISGATLAKKISGKPSGDCTGHGFTSCCTP